MFNGKRNYGYKSELRKRKAIRLVIALAALGILAAVSVPLAAKLKNRAGGERKELLRLWESGDFENVFMVSQTALVSRPMDYFLLTINGFAAYQMGIAQINSPDSLKYIDESINVLRKALLLKNSASDGRVYYVLGKAYSYKGDSFADLAIEYLERARGLSYKAADIPEYLGLAYAAAGDFRSSVAAFTEALEPPSGGESGLSTAAINPPGLLLLSIARSYAALKEFDAARAYLVRCIEVSPDSINITAARLLLGEIMRETGDSGGAEKQYRMILAESGENAEAHYQLGELYAAQGDTAKARAEWRDALKADSTHARSRTRLSM